MRVLLFGTYDAGRHPRVAILGEGLRRHGVETPEADAPLPLDTAARVAILRRPWRLPVLAWHLLRCWVVLLVRTRRVLRAGPVDAVLVGYLGHLDVLLARRRFPRTPVVLDHLVFAAGTARDRGSAGRAVQGLLRRLDRAALTAADVVVLDTDEHLAAVPADLRHKGVVVPVGASPAWFAARPERAPQPDEPLRVVFFGLFTPLQGAAHIGAALALLAPELAQGSLMATMVGSGQDLDASRAAAGEAPGVTWLPWVEPDDLPALVAGHDVCLGIVGTSHKAQDVVPNKVFQGAAVGCALVTGDTAPQRRALGDAAAYVPTGDPAALAAVLRELSRDRARVAELSHRATLLADSAFSPARVVAPLLDRLHAVTD